MTNNWFRILALRGIGHQSAVATKETYQMSKFFFNPAVREMRRIVAGPEDELPREDSTPLGGFRVTESPEIDPLRFKKDE